MNSLSFLSLLLPLLLRYDIVQSSESGLEGDCYTARFPNGRNYTYNTAKDSSKSYWNKTRAAQEILDAHNEARRELNLTTLHKSLQLEGYAREHAQLCGNDSEPDPFSVLPYLEGVSLSINVKVFVDPSMKTTFAEVGTYFCSELAKKDYSEGYVPDDFNADMYSDRYNELYAYFQIIQPDLRRIGCYGQRCDPINNPLRIQPNDYQSIRYLHWTYLICYYANGTEPNADENSVNDPSSIIQVSQPLQSSSISPLPSSNILPLLSPRVSPLVTPSVSPLLSLSPSASPLPSPFVSPLQDQSTSLLPNSRLPNTDISPLPPNPSVSPLPSPRVSLPSQGASSSPPSPRPNSRNLTDMAFVLSGGDNHTNCSSSPFLLPSVIILASLVLILCLGLTLVLCILICYRKRVQSQASDMQCKNELQRVRVKFNASRPTHDDKMGTNLYEAPTLNFMNANASLCESVYLQMLFDESSVDDNLTTVVTSHSYPIAASEQGTNFLGHQSLCENAYTIPFASEEVEQHQQAIDLQNSSGRSYI